MSVSLRLGTAWLFVEISLKPLPTRDELANRSKKNADFAYCFAYCSILFDIVCIFFILHTAICIICILNILHIAICRICRI